MGATAQPKSRGPGRVGLWARLLGLARTIVEGVDLASPPSGEQVLVIRVRPRKQAAGRCPICRRRCPFYDRGDGRRRWRAHDFGLLQCFLEALAPRIRCPRHGVLVADVPWARHDSGHTYAFDDQVAWLATHCSKSAVCQLLRIAWPTVGAIIERVVAAGRARSDPFANLSRIGIDEISYKRGQRYLSVVVDHDSGRLVWAGVGREIATLDRFFALLGPERCALITHVSADAGSWIAPAVSAHCPNAKLCIDPFHVVSWATDALDEVRREVWNAARRAGQKAIAKDVKGARWALWRNPEDLSPRQTAKLADIAASNKKLYRAYLLKEQLRQVFHLPHAAAMQLLDEWLAWARRCRMAPFVKLAKTITKLRTGISDAIEHGLSNGRIESVNNKIRLLTRVAFGFRSSGALISLALLSLGGYCPALPGRN